MAQQTLVGSEAMEETLQQLRGALYTKTEVNGLLPIYAEEEDIDEMFD